MIEPPVLASASGVLGAAWDVLQRVLGVSDASTRTLLDWTGTLFERQGYLVTFLGVLLENTLFFGFLVPGALLLVVAGMAAENGDVSLALVFGAGLGGALIGDTLSYLTGRYLWSRAFAKDLERLVGRLREPLQRNSAWLVLSYHFAGYTRMIGPTAAGLFQLPFRRWAPFDYGGVTAWVIAYLGAGYILAMFGIDLEAAKRNVRIIDLVLLAMAVVAIGLFLRNSLRRREGPADAAAVTVEPVDETATN